MSTITHLTSLPELNKLLAAKKERLVVIDFHATWCGPCHAIAPTFEKLANQYRQATFCKVDVDAAQEIARAYSVRAMPTFVFIKNEHKVHEVKGANASAIEAGIKQFVGGSAGEAGAFPGQGHTLTGTPVPTEAPPAEANYVRWLILGALALWWFWSARQSKEQ